MLRARDDSTMTKLPPLRRSPHNSMAGVPLTSSPSMQHQDGMGYLSKETQARQVSITWGLACTVAAVSALVCNEAHSGALACAIRTTIDALAAFFGTGILLYKTISY